jgi:hypothetical protein
MFAAHRMTPFIAPKLRRSVLVSGGLKGIKEAITCCLGPKIRRGLQLPFESSCNQRALKLARAGWSGRPHTSAAVNRLVELRTLFDIRISVVTND